MQIGPLDRPSVFDVVGGDEDTHFNPVCATEINRIVEPVLGIDVDDVQREVLCLGRRLDLLATADTRRVAIELQYGEADPSHLGRLIAWYAPHVAATDTILVAESFPSVLVTAVRENRVPNIALVRVIAGWNADGSPGLDFELIVSNITPEQKHSLAADQKTKSMRDSISLLGDALAQYGLRDSNALRYVRLFPIRHDCWANVIVRSGRVVINIGSYKVVDAESASRELTEDWGAHGNGLYLTVSQQVESYVLDPAAVHDIAKGISDMQDELNEAIDAVAATIRDEDENDTEGGGAPADFE